jgi:hypothetical protein
MARINIPVNKTHERTHEGGIAARTSNYDALRRSVLSCLLWEDTFYEDGVDIATRIADLVTKVQPNKVAQLAVEARQEMYLRHVPLLLLRELVRTPTGRLFVRNALTQVIQRPDELAEFLAIYWKEGKEPLAASVKKALAEAFTKFDAYQLAKYDRDGPVKLRDVLFLTHAKPKDAEQEKTWKKLVEGTLESPDTWEVGLSAGRDKKKVFERLLTENKLGGLALLRNLRNMLQAGVDLQLLKNSVRENSFKWVLPFRFISAARYAPLLEDVLEEAMLRSLQEHPKLPGRTAIVVDHSGSMRAALSGKSELTRFDAACGLTILLREICEEVSIISFNSHATDVPPRRGFALAEALEKAQRWGWTNVQAGKRRADELGYYRVIVITDEQTNYVERLTNPNKGSIGYLINVAPYQRGIGYGNWIHIDGWSESVVRFIMEYENFKRT